MLQTHFDQIKVNLAEIQPKNHQNVQKTHFLRKVPGVNGLNIFKNWFMLSERISSYGCTREVWRARKKRKSCSRRSREQL